MKKQVLVIDDDLVICRDIQHAMQDSILDVVYTTSKDEALNTLTQQEYCMIIMGVSSPVNESITTIQHIRNTKTIPILILTENVSASDKVLLFQAGISAYLEKPFDMDVCVAQVKSLTQLHAEALAENRLEQPLKFGTELVIDSIYRQVLVDGVPLELTHTEFELLLCLAQHWCQVWSYSQLYHYVWNDPLGLDGDNTVKTHIGNLKKKLAHLGKSYIQNSRGVGYKFVPPDHDESGNDV